MKTFETLIHARKVKNGEDGFTLKATLRQLVMGKDSDGDDVTTLVVDRVELDKRTKVRKVPVRAIHEHMLSAGLLDDDPRNRRFRELKLEMVAPKTGRFIERDGMVWLLYPERPFVFRTKDEN